MMICNFLFLVVMGPDLDLNEGLVEMVVIKRLWPYPEGIDLASGGFRATSSTTKVFKANTGPQCYLDKKLRIIWSPFGVMIDSGWNCTP